MDGFIILLNEATAIRTSRFQESVHMVFGKVASARMGGLHQLKIRRK